MCRLEPGDWYDGTAAPRTHAFVFLIKFGLEPKTGEPGAEWIRGSNVARTDLRIAELAVVIAGCVRALGWSARGHTVGDAQVEPQAGTEVDIERLAQRAGVCKATGGVWRCLFRSAAFDLAW